MTNSNVHKYFLGGVVVYLAMVACSGSMTDGSAMADPSQSGSRLKVRRLVANDGATQFAGWHDTDRDEDCDFTTVADGSTRCLPTGMVTLTDVGYSDKSCASPVALVFGGKTCGSPKYGRLSSTDRCNPSDRIFTLGAPLPSQNIYFKTASGGCNAMVMGESWPVTEVSLDSFVGATNQVQ